MRKRKNERWTLIYEREGTQKEVEETLVKALTFISSKMSKDSIPKVGEGRVRE